MKRQSIKYGMALGIALLTLFLGSNSVNALCIAGDPGYPNCNSSGTKPPVTGGETYESCKAKCNNVGPGQKDSCLSSCEPLNSKVIISDHCKNNACMGSAADSGNKCCAQNGSGTTGDKTYDPAKDETVKPTEKPKVEEGKNPTLSASKYNIPSTTCGGSIELPTALATITSKAVDLLKIAIPLIIIIFGMIDFARATAAKKEDEIKKAQTRFIHRLMAGVAASLVIIIVQTVFLNFGKIEGIPTVTTCINCFINGNC